MSTPGRIPPEALDAWLLAAAAELNIGTEDLSIKVILDVAADIAHSVARPAAPLSTFLMGIALGARREGETLEGLAQQLSVLASQWEASQV